MGSIVMAHAQRHLKGSTASGKQVTKSREKFEAEMREATAAAYDMRNILEVQAEAQGVHDKYKHVTTQCRDLCNKILEIEQLRTGFETDVMTKIKEHKNAICEGQQPFFEGKSFTAEEWKQYPWSGFLEPGAPVLGNQLLKDHHVQVVPPAGVQLLALWEKEERVAADEIDLSRTEDQRRSGALYQPVIGFGPGKQLIRGPDGKVQEVQMVHVGPNWFPPACAEASAGTLLAQWKWERDPIRGPPGSAPVMLVRELGNAKNTS